MERFIHLRLWQRLSLCPLGNNLVSLGLHGERFQKNIKNFFSSILRENWSGDPRKRMKYKKLLTQKLIIDFEMFRDARNENKRPYWIGDHVWNNLLSHWNAPKYRFKCA
ncbi:hypothetical protein GmHk_20G057339 [Glycine max]|nr:hypothetical protein GmHk_20G057339 [Glycine max]